MDETLAIHGGEPITTEPFPSSVHGAEEISQEEIDAVIETLSIKKPFRYLHKAGESKVGLFESKFREFIGTEYALAVNSGTSALIAALVGIGIGSGDEVILPGYTYISSASAVLAANAIPVIAEIDNSLTLDPKDVERKITPSTRAIMPVHMRGVPCNMDEITAIARRHGLKIIEDVAQANGGSFNNKMLGSIGDVGAFSLQYHKIITSGEGGFVTTNDKTVFSRAAFQHDSAMMFWHRDFLDVEPFDGENYRMNELQGALGLVQMKRIAAILSKLREIKGQILVEIADIPGIELQKIPDRFGDCGVSLAIFLPDEVKTKEFSAALKAEGIPNGSLYDNGIPDRHLFYNWSYVMQKSTADRHGCPWTCPYYQGSVSYSKEMLPQTMNLLKRTILMPIGQSLAEKHIDWISKGIKKVANALL